ncbi:hypothetical protein [Dechloromonas sp. CZR5]|uniref:hypothetical protein n=1 Tax=Dechloromonas sp. CZR5 TaxID=2608630 RepID=UPI00123D1E1A|nr:hypothetical protein [Dechloromonas sp. CZR5]
MTITVDWQTRIINSTASIPDLPAFHAVLRDLEDDATGAIYPVTHTWKALDLGGGAFMYQLDLINGYQLKFPNAGNYTISGNLNAVIVPAPGVYVERNRSVAYVTTAVGGSGPNAEDIAAAVWSHTQAVELANRLAEAWARLGLDPSRPLMQNETQISFGAVLMALSEAGGAVTVTRQ